MSKVGCWLEMIGDSHQIEFYLTTIRLIIRLSASLNFSIPESFCSIHHLELGHTTQKLNKKETHNPGNSPPI